MKFVLTLIALIVTCSSVHAAKRFMPMLDDDVLKETRVDYLTTIPEVEDGEQSTNKEVKRSESQGITPSEAASIIAPATPRISPISPAQGVSVQVRPR